MIIKINKFNFAINGSWESLPSDKNPVDLVKAKKKRHYSVYKNHENNMAYFGTFMIAKPSSRMYCFSSFIKDVCDADDFIFVHESEGKTYYVGYRSGVLDIKTDKVKSPAEAKKEIRAYISKWNIQNLYFFDSLAHEDELFVPNSNRLNSKDLRSIDKKYLINDANSSTDKAKNIFLVLFMLTAVGFMAWHLIGETFKDEPLVRQVTNKGPTEQEIQTEKDKIIKQKLAEIYSYPLANDLLEKCGDHIDSAPDVIDFWNKIIYSCSSSNFSYSYQRDQYGAVPSEFSKHLKSKSPVEKTEFLFKLPVVVKGTFAIEFESRDFVPTAINDIDIQAVDDLLDVLSRFSDVATINTLSEARTIGIGAHELDGQQIIFTQNELFKQGSFTLRSGSLTHIINANNLFDQNHVLLSGIEKKGDYYDANFNYITR